MNNRTTVKYFFAASTLLTPFISTAAFAAEQIDEIVVTAQKREEKLQDVPIAITALGPAQLESRNIATTQDLSAIAPNLTTGPSTSGAGDTTISMRGLPAADALLSQDAPVGIYIDGVINARIAGSVLDLVDLERVEVLRGPQGTLYGRNTTGGAVNFITRKPSGEFGITQKLSYINPNGNNGFASRTVLDTGEWGDTGLSATLNFLYKKVDGYYDNTAQPSDKDPGAENVRAGRIALNFDKGDQFRANYSLYYLEQENGNAVGQVTALSPAVLASITGPLKPITQERRETVNLPRQSTDDIKLWLHNLTLELDISDNLSIKSITGYRDYQNRTGVQFGEFLDIRTPTGFNAFGLPTGFASVNSCLFCATNARTHQQLSQELQLNGQYGETVPGGDRLIYTFGAYYFTEDASERNPQSLNFPVAAIPASVVPPSGVPAFGIPVTNPFAFDTSTDSWAIFGQASYTPHILDDKLRLTGGLRYSSDEKETITYTSITNLTPKAQANKKFNAVTYLAKGQYFFTDNVNGYLSYSRGYKAGGFNTRAALEPFNPEKLNALELGLKSTWFNRRLQANLSVFRNKSEDQQLSSFVAGASGATAVTRNVGSSTYDGAEIEILAKPFKSFSFGMNLGFLNPQYDEYLSADPVTKLLFDAKDVARFGYTSEMTGSAGVQYDSDPIGWLGDSMLQARIDTTWQSKQDFHVAIKYPSGNEENPLINFVRGDARTVVNGRVALRDIPLGSTKAELAIWGKNLLDEEYVVQGIDFGSLGIAEQSFGPPRIVGVDFTVRY